MYSNLAIIPGVSAGGYAAHGLSEVITNSPTAGIAALVAGASIMGFVAKKCSQEIGKIYFCNKEINWTQKR